MSFRNKLAALLLAFVFAAGLPLGAMPAFAAEEAPQAAPAQVYAAATTPKVTVKISAATATSLTIKWNKTSNVKRVQVYQSNKKASGYQCIATLKNATKYVALGLAENKAYYFKVRVTYKNGKRSTSNYVKKQAVKGDYSVISSYNQYGPAHKQQVKDAVAHFVNTKIKSGMSTYEKVMAAHDYLVKNVSYAPDYSKNGANSAWGALIYGQAQCSGYAWAFQKMCEAMGIGCRYVEADSRHSNPQHRWSMVRVNKKWYHIDVQCNDSSGWNAVLLAGDKYVRMLGYSWNEAAYPKCPANYAAA